MKNKLVTHKLIDERWVSFVRFPYEMTAGDMVNRLTHTKGFEVVDVVGGFTFLCRSKDYEIKEHLRLNKKNLLKFSVNEREIAKEYRSKTMRSFDIIDDPKMPNCSSLYTEEF